MKSDRDQVPYNPFVAEGEVVDESRLVGLSLLDIPYTADGIESIAKDMDWSEIEIQALRDAAEMIRWSAQISGLPESQVIHNRLNNNGGLTLILREAGEDR